MGMIREDYSNPGYGFDMYGAPNTNNDPLRNVNTGYGNIQPPATLEGGFGSIINNLYNNGYSSNVRPKYTTPGAVLGAITGAPFTVSDEGGQAMINPRGGFSVNGSNYGIDLSPHNIGASYRTDDGKTQLTAGVSPLGGDNFGVTAGFTHNPQDPVSNRILIEGLPNQNSNETTLPNPEIDPQAFLKKRMGELGVVSGGGSGGLSSLGAY